MAMQGIDIASYQAGIDLNAVPCDFAIVKATEGTGYTNPDCDRAIQQLYSLGKPSGVYFYARGINGEADFFVDKIQGYIGRSILCIDWESGDNNRWGDMGYLDGLITTIINRTGVKPLIYAPQRAYDEIAAVASAHDCGVWLQKYANMNDTGYQDSPWDEESYNVAMRQYSSCGCLANWSGHLDLDKFYGDVDAWNAYVGIGKPVERSVNVQLWQNNGSDAQKFSVEWEGDYVTLTNVASGLCLDVSNAGTTDGTNVQVYTPNGTDAQKWKIINAPGDYRPDAPVEFVPKVNESMRLDANACGTDWGTNIQIWSANDSDAQKFTIIDHGGGVWTIVNNHAMLPLDVVNGGN